MLRDALARFRQRARRAASPVLASLLTVASAALAIAPAPAVAQTPQSGGLLRTVGIDPTTLDPHLVSDTQSSAYALEIFSGLTTISPRLQIVPDLAERWAMSEDGTTFTFSLLPNAQFQDGRPLTADDVKYSIERAADPATGSPVAETYLGDIVGVREKLAGEANEVVGVQAVDERTIKLTIDGPKIYFLAKLAYPTAFVVDRSAVESGPEWWLSNPNGSGPFQFFAYQPGFGLLLARNDGYYREPAYVDGVIFDLRGGSWLDRYEADAIDYQPAIFAQDVDAVFDRNGPFWNDLVRDASGNPGVVEMSVSYVGFNARQAPFDDPRVRQAFSRSVDKHLLNETIFRNLNVVATGILPPSIPGFDRSLRGLDYNPAQARQLLAQSRYAGKLPPVTITVAGAGGPVGGLVAGLVDQWQRNLGVSVEVEQVDWESFLEDTRTGRTQMFSLGWSADYPDPSDFLDVLFHSESTQNHTGYSNPAVDQLLEAARGEGNVQTRLRLYQQAERIIVQDAPWLPLSFGRDYPLVKPWVHGLTFSGMDISRLRFVWLDQQ